jgi:hypothetical protein
MERLPHFGAENESASDSKQLGCSRFPAAGPPAHARYAPRTAIVVLIVLRRSRSASEKPLIS